MASADLSAAAGVDLTSFTRRYADAWNECDVSAMAELLTEDVVWADPALAEPARGVAAVQDFMRASSRTFPDLRFSEPEEPHLSVAGDCVAWAWTMDGAMRGPADPPGFAPTGRTMHVEGVDLGAPVTSVASAPAAGAREDARSLLGGLAQEGQKQLAAISPLG